jgi:hypothetical protein
VRVTCQWLVGKRRAGQGAVARRYRPVGRGTNAKGLGKSLFRVTEKKLLMSHLFQYCFVAMVSGQLCIAGMGDGLGCWEQGDRE